MWAQPNINAPYAIRITSAVDSIPPGAVGVTMTIKQPTIGGIQDFLGEQAVNGNAACSGACNPVTGAGCSLPCLLCGAGRIDSVGGLQCPGIAGNGEVNFFDNSPAPEPTEEECAQVTPEQPYVPVQDQVTWTVNNDCDPLIAGQPCNSTPNLKQEVGASFITCPESCPYVTIKKTCDRTDIGGTCYGDITVVVANPKYCSNDESRKCFADDECASGGTCTVEGGTLTNCLVTDTLAPATDVPLYSAQGACSNDNTKACVRDVQCGAGTCEGEVAATPIAQIAPGVKYTFKGFTPGLPATTLNSATVTCDSKVPTTACPNPVTTATDSDPCECGDNYKCYTVKPVPRSERFPGATVGLEDQFRTTSARLLTPYEFCNPVDKNGEGIANPDAHLMCYKFIDRTRPASVPVEVTDQFGTEQLRTSSANVLCVPALKNCDPMTESCSIGALEEVVNHFQCYGALPLLRGDTLLTPPGPVQLRDQFTDSLVTFPTVQRRHLCTPTSKNGGGVPDETEHLKCYDIRDEERFLGTEINVIDQFGTWDLRVGQARELCESAEKTRLDRGPVEDTRSRSRR